MNFQHALELTSLKGKKIINYNLKHKSGHILSIDSNNILWCDTCNVPKRITIDMILSKDWEESTT